MTAPIPQPQPSTAAMDDMRDPEVASAMRAEEAQHQPSSAGTKALREAVATELIAHGEFSISGNNYPNALLAADQVIKIVRAHTSDVAAEGREPLIRELCGDEINGGLIRDLCFTVWNICHHPTNADGNADWSNDTLPTVQKAVEIVRGKLRDAAQKVKDTDVAQLNTDRAPDADEVTGDVGSNPAVGAQGVQELQELENDAFRGGLSAEAFAATQGGDKGEAVAWTKEALIEVIMRETTDKIVADGRDHLGSPNALVQGCKFIRRNMRTDPTEGYEDPEGAAKKFAGFIADAILAAAPQPASIAYPAWQPIASAPRDWLSPILAWNSRQPTWPPVVVRWNKDGNEEIDGDPHWSDAATASGDALYFNQNFFDLWMPCPSTSIPSTDRGAGK